MNYYQTYEAMYQNGYRNKRKCAGAAFLRYANIVLKYQSILDVGCGWGEALGWLLAEGRKAIGVDVSTTAVEDARDRGLSVRVASILSLPFDENEFDVTFSSDVIEHLTPEDVDEGITEMIRVAKKYVVLQIATCPTKHQWKEIVDIPNIHLTLIDPQGWLLKMKTIANVDINFYGYSKHHVFFILGKRNV